MSVAFGLSPADALASQTVGVAVTQITGTAPFDSSVGRGMDASATDDIVRSNDTVSYLVQVNVNDPGAGSSTATNVTVTQTLPAGLKWTRLPATCLLAPVVPSSEISPDGQTITCNIGSIPTGQAVTVTLSANVTEMTDGVALAPDPGSVTATADGTNTATATPDPVTVTSIPRVDMVKSAPNVTATNYNGTDGFFVNYPVRVEIPNFGGRGLIGYGPPAAAMSLDEDFASVSPNAEFVGCGPDKGGTWTCPAAGSPSPAPIDITVSDPNQISSGTLSSTTVTIFVPKSDLDADPDGTLVATNTIENLDATDPSGSPAEGEILSNNSVKVTLSTNPGSGFGVYKHYIDVTNKGRYIPGGSNVDRNGFSAVGVGQIFQAEVRVSANNAAAGYSSVKACDVFDATSQKMTLSGPASSSTYGKGKPAWITANSVPGNLPLVEGTDFVIEYSNDATSTDPTDATRWNALRANDCSSGTWTTTSPTTEGDANAVKRVRLRFLTTPPLRYTLTFAVNLAAVPGTDGEKIANFAPYDVGAGSVASTYQPLTHTGSRGDRLILTAAQVKLAKDIIEPQTPATGTPNVRPGEDIKFGLRPHVFVPSQSITPGIVTAREVTVTDVLPKGTALSKLSGHTPSSTPASVTANADGTTTIIWKMGTLTSNDAPLITYWITVAGTASGTKVNRAIVTSPDDATSPTAIPTSGTDPHYAARTLTIDSLGGIQVDKDVLKDWVEPTDVVTYSVTYANLDAIDREGMDVIDVLPFNGDGSPVGNVPGRSPASHFHGTVRLKSVNVSDVETVRYTDASPAAVYGLYDPSAASPGFDALPAGKAWCTAAEITAADAGCPKSISTATAIRVTREEDLGANETATFTYSVDTSSSRSGDVYSNTAALRSSSLLLGTLSPTRTARVVASRVGDFVWKDLNKNGRQDGGKETGVSGVSVLLEGTDKHGKKVRIRTKTNSHGKYLFTSSSQSGQTSGIRDLVSGTYRITFLRSTLPKYARLTTRKASRTSDQNDSDPYVSSGRTAGFRLADPTPHMTDGINLTFDAGIFFAYPAKRSPNFTG